MNSLRADLGDILVLALVCVASACGRAVTDVAATLTSGSGGASSSLSSSSGHGAGGSGTDGGAGGAADDSGVGDDGGPCKGVGIWRTVSNNSPWLGDENSAVVWTGTKMAVWSGGHWSDEGFIAHPLGSRYLPSKDTWTAMTTDGVPGGRAGGVGAWTGSEMLVWGGRFGSTAVGDGGRYALSSDTWAPMAAGGPSPRADHAGVWTGARFIVWGGSDGTTTFGDGARYDPTTDSWAPVSKVGAPNARSRHAAVWTGKEMIVWGGGSDLEGHVLGTGGRYDPSSDTWKPMSDIGAPSPRIEATSVWTGTTMVVWGGDKLVTSGDTSSYVAFGDGAAYDPASDTWAPLSTVGAPEARFWHAAVWTGTRMIIWGGARDAAPTHELATGGLYDPASDTWEATAECGAAVASRSFASVWTGKELIVVGGSAGAHGAYAPP